MSSASVAHRNSMSCSRTVFEKLQTSKAVIWYSPPYINSENDCIPERIEGRVRSGMKRMRLQVLELTERAAVAMLPQRELTSENQRQRKSICNTCHY